ncbi:MAG: T9SS type A sorting domain-containing protein [bacterium]|nr:T9SS type A sorting domain-containing protein [bacterium]
MREYIFIALTAVLFAANVSPAFGGWNIMTADNYERQTGAWPCLELDSIDNPHIVYGRGEFGDDFGYEMGYAYYNFYSAHPKWSAATIIEGTKRYSFALDDDDIPHITFRNSGDPHYSVRYAYWDGSAWDISIPDPYVYNYGNSSIAIDSKGNPHISYYEASGSNLKYCYWNGSTWIISTVDSKGDCGFFSSLELSSNDRPHISYTDTTNEKLNYAFWDGSTWRIYVVDDIAHSALADGRNDIELDEYDRPHISYDGLNAPDTNALKYAYWISRTWTIETISDIYTGMSAHSLALDSNNDPHISYAIFSNNHLKYAYKSGSSWSISTVPDAEAIASLTSIEVDSDNYPHIAFHMEVADPFSHLGYAYYDYIGGKNAGNIRSLPSAFTLGPATPNPMVDTAAVTFALPRACEVNLSLFDIKGRKIKTLAEGHFEPGEHTADISGLSSGLYIFKLETDGFSDTGKMVVK